ncbi:MAG: radical SAM protein, partial [Planctomycetota bacterium]|nr:radical SAM protein [Planctomycetota bacterium]
MQTVLDLHQRPLRSLRVSVTDRCNLRCSYCMPEEEYTWLERDHLLRFGQLTEVVRAATLVGTRRVRLTGGEPLLRRELWRLVEQLAALELEDLALTTNGVHLAQQVETLAQAGLDRVTISLDTLRPERFRKLTRRDALEPTLAGIEAAVQALPGRVKINTVLMAGVNDDEVLELLAWARDLGCELR